jgi:hypothetical protein
LLVETRADAKRFDDVAIFLERPPAQALLRSATVLGSQSARYLSIDGSHWLTWATAAASFRSTTTSMFTQ